MRPVSTSAVGLIPERYYKQPMSPNTRRRFLEITTLATASAVAGCSGGSGNDEQDGRNQTATDGDSLHLESLDVGGSPGGPISIQPTGAVALVDFFATWCAPCKPEMANLRAVRERFDAETLSMVSITQESDRELVREFWTENEGTWPVALDPDLEATQEYGVQNIPTIIVFTQEGEEVWRHVGLAGEDSLVEAVEEARGGESG